MRRTRTRIRWDPYNLRLIVALPVEGWSCRLADQQVDERVRYHGIPDDRVFANTADEAVSIVSLRLADFDGQHRGVIRRV